MKLTTTRESGGEYMRAVLYGNSGEGKTFASSTAPGPILRWNIRGEGDGEATLADKDIATLQINTYDDLAMAYAALVGKINGLTIYDPTVAEVSLDKDACKELLAEVKKIKPATLVIDSFLALQELFMQQSVTKTGGESKNKFQKWGDLADLSKFWVDRLLDLPMHIILVTLAERVEDEASGRVMYEPSYPGKASRRIVNPRMTCILPVKRRKETWDEAEVRDRYFQTRTGNDWLAKVRFPISTKLESFIPADLTQLHELFQATKGVKVDA